MIGEVVEQGTNKMPDFMGFGQPGAIVSFAFSIMLALLFLRSKYSKGSLEANENEAKSSFIKDLIGELQAVKAAANTEVQKYKDEAHETHVKYTKVLVDIATLTEINRSLASTNTELLTENRELGHANQNLKQLVIIYAPSKVKDRILNSQYGRFDGRPEDMNDDSENTTG